MLDRQRRKLRKQTIIRNLLSIEDKTKHLFLQQRIALLTYFLDRHFGAEGMLPTARDSFRDIINYAKLRDPQWVNELEGLENLTEESW